MTTPDQHARFRPCPIGCGWTQEPTEFDDETGLRAGRGQHLDGHTTYEIIEALEHRTAERDKAATERDRLARRCALRFEETEKLRAQIDAHEGEMGDLRASLSAAEAERDRLEAERDEARAKRDQVVENAVAWMDEARHQAVERDRLADTLRRVRELVDSYPAGSNFAQSGLQQLFRRTLDGADREQKTAHPAASADIHTGPDTLSWADAAARVSADAQAIKASREDLAERDGQRYADLADETGDDRG